MKQRLLSSGFQKFFEDTNVLYLFAARNAPHRAILVSNKSGDYQLHLYDFNTGFHRKATNMRGGRIFGSLSADGEYLYYLKDTAGNEHGHFVREPFFGGRKIDVTPEMPPYFSYSISTDERNSVLCFTIAQEQLNSVFAVQLKKEKTFENPKKLYSTKNSLSDPIVSPCGKYCCVSETKEGDGTSVLVLLHEENTKEGAVSKSSQSFSSVTPLAFSKESASPVVLAGCRKQNWIRPVFYDFSKKWTTEISHPKFQGDIWVLEWNERENTLILCDVYRGEQKLYLYNTKRKTLKRIGPKTGSFNFHFDAIATSSDRDIILKWHDINHSSKLLKLKAPKYNTWEVIEEFSGNIQTDYEVKNVTFRSSDNEDVQMWIVKPQNAKKSLPFLLDLHGGPHGVSGNEYSPEISAWLSSGFGYAAVNYRGSIGFGKKFERAIYGSPGKYEVEDAVSARNWLVKYQNASSIILSGWSWGGYVTLLTLGKYPEFWDAGIAGASIADTTMQYEDGPAFFQALDKQLFKGTPKTAQKTYAESSPSTYAENIQAPVLLLHGKNDVRCPPRQIEYFTKLLKKHKKVFSLEWYSSGHTGDFTDTKLRMKLFEKAVRFAKAHRK